MAVANHGGDKATEWHVLVNSEANLWTLVLTIPAYHGGHLYFCSSLQTRAGKRLRKKPRFL